MFSKSGLFHYFPAEMLSVKSLYFLHVFMNCWVELCACTRNLHFRWHNQHENEFWTNVYCIFLSLHVYEFIFNFCLNHIWKLNHSWVWKVHRYHQKKIFKLYIPVDAIMYLYMHGKKLFWCVHVQRTLESQELQRNCLELQQTFLLQIAKNEKMLILRQICWKFVTVVIYFT
jgi:hypothetical protein